MTRFSKGLLFASLLALSSGAASLAPAVAKADTSFGYTGLGSATVKVIDTGAQIYDSEGNSTGRFLPMGSSWKTDLENTLSSGSYFGIGKNEFVKSSDVDYLSSVGGLGQTETNYDGVEVTFSDGAAIYDVNGNPIGRTLPAGSDWKIDLQNNLSSGTYYRVGKGEYVKASEVRVYQNSIVRPINQTITTNSGAPKSLYNSNGQLIRGRALAPNTSWHTDEFSDIGHVGYYRVATNEYVSVVDVD